MLCLSLQCVRVQRHTPLKQESLRYKRHRCASHPSLLFFLFLRLESRSHNDALSTFRPTIRERLVHKIDTLTALLYLGHAGVSADRVIDPKSACHRVLEQLIEIQGKPKAIRLFD